MSNRNQSLWPYSTRTALLAVPIVLVILILLVAVTRAVTGWPTNDAERFVLIGIFILSLVPLLLLLIDGFAARGAVLEYAGLKLAFSQIAQSALPSLLVPTNIGVTGRPVGDSGSHEILEALRRAGNNEVVIIDLEEGDAWWETRLLVLLAGLSRLGTPRAVVFVATEGGQPSRYQGWSAPDTLLRLLLPVNPQYEHIYYEVEAAAKQWALLAPSVSSGGPVAPDPFCLTGMAQLHRWMAFEGARPNPLAREQLFASELGRQIEQTNRPRTITTIRLKELFVAALNTHVIEQNAPSNEQIKQFFADTAAYIAVTQHGVYHNLIPRANALSAMVAALASK